MFLSVFDIFKIGIGPSSLAHDGADDSPRSASSTRCATAGTACPAGAPRPARREAARLARLHRQGPCHRPRRGRSACSASAPADLDPDAAERR